MYGYVHSPCVMCRVSSALVPVVSTSCTMSTVRVKPMRVRVSDLLSTMHTIHKGYSSSLGSGYSTLSTVASQTDSLPVDNSVYVHTRYSTVLLGRTTMSMIQAPRYEKGGDKVTLDSYEQ